MKKKERKSPRRSRRRRARYSSNRQIGFLLSRTGVIYNEIKTADPSGSSPSLRAAVLLRISRVLLDIQFIRRGAFDRCAA